ncbi:MAG: hypothetical protein ACTSP4_02895 [Candidatus Hodarchaeales archaeon]
MKTFIDIVRPSRIESPVLDRYIIRALWLGIRGLLVECPPANLKEFKRYKTRLLESCLATLNEEYLTLSNQQKAVIEQKLKEFNIWPCLVIEGKNDKRGIKLLLQNYRKRYPVIIVECSSAEITKWAIQDNRVDGIFFPLKTGSRLFDIATARIMGKEKFLMIGIEDFVMNFNQRVQFARDLRKNLFYAKKKDTNIVCCSRASLVSMMRATREIQGLIAEMGEYPLDKLKISGNTVLWKVIKTNLFRNSPAYLGPGVVLDEDGNNEMKVNE